MCTLRYAHRIHFLRIAGALVVVGMPLAGDDTRFFQRRFFRFPPLCVLFSRFLTLKNVKNGIPCTVNYILSFEFRKKLFHSTRKIMRIYSRNYQPVVSKGMIHSSIKRAKLQVLPLLLEYAIKLFCRKSSLNKLRTK